MFSIYFFSLGLVSASIPCSFLFYLHFYPCRCFLLCFFFIRVLLLFYPQSDYPLIFLRISSPVQFIYFFFPCLRFISSLGLFPRVHLRIVSLSSALFLFPSLQPTSPLHLMLCFRSLQIPYFLLLLLLFHVSYSTFVKHPITVLSFSKTGRQRDKNIPSHGFLIFQLRICLSFYLLFFFASYLSLVYTS